MNVNTFHEQSEAAKNILSNRQNIRRFLKNNDMHVDQLTKIIDRLDAVRNEYLEEEKKQEELRKEKLEKLEEAKKVLRENGLSVNDLVQTEMGNGLPRKSGKRRSDAGKAKHNPMGIYAYEDEKGNKKEIQMPRVGRAPTEFTEYLHRTGKKRKDCLVREIDEKQSEKQSQENQARGLAQPKAADNKPEQSGGKEQPHKAEKKAEKA